MKMKEINFKKIEEKWQKKWEEEKVFEAKENSKKKKYYVLEMFPYPSGSGLHMGHAWNYTIGDIFARFKIMSGYNVLHPMGYDALGLPAENAAIIEGEHPEDYTKKSIKKYIKQQRNLGLSYDWSRMISSADASYYKWDQWIFLKMLEKGLAYQKEAAVNWCPECKTVLANEQVVNGKCWRHEDTNVEIRHLKQWFFKITKYSEELLQGHNRIDWPEKTVAMQKNWIGKSQGTEILFEINGKKWPIFTTRPDTIFGVSFMVISAQHPRLMEIVTQRQAKEAENFLKKIKTVSQKSIKDLEELEKEGVFTGSYAVHPITGEKIPVYAGNFVVADYGSGMIMAVPGHDQRDFEFAKKYKIKIKQVIEGKITKERAYTGEGKLINSEEFNGINSREAIDKISFYLESKGIGKKVVQYKLRDWLISRQRYWGTPIPIIYCEKCGAVPVPEKELPVKLPREVEFGKGNPLATNESWIRAKCPKCGSIGRRETDTMDTFVNSSWYFLRYCDTHNDEAIFDKKKVEYWMPVNVYIGGAEHACMHLIYARFYTKFLRDLGLIRFDEPFLKLFHQGMLRGEGGVKISKSKPETVILPEVVSDKYGIDTARYFLCSLASPDKDIDWSDKGINGSLRFINRIFEAFEKLEISKKGKDSEELERKLNSVIKNVSEQIQNFEYRKATIEIKELFELIHEQKEISKSSIEKALKILNPFCPHITEELWERIGNKPFISTAEWPKAEEKIIRAKNTVNASEKIISGIKEIVTKYEKNNSFSKFYIYVMPFEMGKLNEEKISKEFGKKTKVYAVNDSKKYDPEGKAGKAKPGKPAIYFE
jgi:leucyl-tRNA synthetase